jgi:hypothetical protein
MSWKLKKGCISNSGIFKKARGLIDIRGALGCQGRRINKSLQMDKIILMFRLEILSPSIPKFEHSLLD